MIQILKEQITYKSTNGKISGISFREALLKGLAPDGGLYMPERIPVISKDELDSFRSSSYHEIAANLLNNYTQGEIPGDLLKRLCREAYNFAIPIESISDQKYILRLDQGPTASFKDFAARMMSRLMQHFLSEENRNLTILTATSGDTGSAVASAFHGLKNIRLIILFPEDEVTEMQRKQMTTLGDNISIISVKGKFDDCQSLVKKAFLDSSLAHLPLSSANSINIGRLLPQTVYYFYAWSRLSAHVEDKVTFSVPSGNFGNLTAGLFAKKMGMPAEKFIVATNSNDEVPVFLRTGKYIPLIPSRNCISSAMNVGHPSNLARMISLYGGTMDEKGNILSGFSGSLKQDLFGVSVTDEETRNTIGKVWKEHSVLIEPHGAVAWKGLSEYLKTARKEGIFVSLETAHPAKFPGELQKVLNITPALPSSMSKLDSLEEKYDSISSDYQELKDYILQKH